MATAEQVSTAASNDRLLERVVRWLLVASVAVLALLFWTGVYLTWNYRPSPPAWITPIPSVRFEEAVKRVHHFAATGLLGLLGATVVLSVLVALLHRRWVAPLAAAIAAIVAFAGSFSGRLLRWDQLALWAVTVGTNLRGYTLLWDGARIRYVLLGHSEMSVGELRVWYLDRHRDRSDARDLADLTVSRGAADQRTAVDSYRDRRR